MRFPNALEGADLLAVAVVLTIVLLIETLASGQASAQSSSCA
jgi:hypothetical protein